MQEMELVFTKIANGEPFKILNSVGKTLSKWATVNSMPNFREVIENKLDINGSLVIDFGRKHGQNPDGSERYARSSSMPLSRNKSTEILQAPPVPPVSPVPQAFAVGPGLAGYDVQTMFLSQKIQDLKEENTEKKIEIKELKNEVSTLKEQNTELKFKISVKDKEFELENQMLKYNEGNSFSGVIKTLTNPETAQSLAGYVSAVKGEMNQEPSSAPALNGIDTDLKRAIVERISIMDDLEAQLVWGTINSENWQKSLKKAKN